MESVVAVAVVSAFIVEALGVGITVGVSNVAFVDVDTGGNSVAKTRLFHTGGPACFYFVASFAILTIELK